MRDKFFITAMIILVTIAISFTSCKKSSDTNTPGTPVTEGVYIGNSAVNFTEIDSQGNPISLDSFKGKVILLTFSAMWCGPCRHEAAELMNLYNTYKAQGFEIVQCIFQDEDRNPADLSDMARWMGEFGITFNVFNDDDQSTVGTWEFSGIPFNVVIDRNFVVKARISGSNIDAIESHIKSAL